MEFELEDLCRFIVFRGAVCVGVAGGGVGRDFAIEVDEDFARVGAAGRSNDSLLLHLVDESCRTGVAYAQRALKRGSRSTVGTPNHVECGLVKFVATGGTLRGPIISKVVSTAKPTGIA